MATSIGENAPALRNVSSSSERAPLLLPVTGGLSPNHIERSEESFGIYDQQHWISRSKAFLRWFLPSKYGHYFVIILVSLDITCIFADFIISLHVCEHRRDKGFNKKAWTETEDILGSFGLVFSTLFIVELLASLFAFGIKLEFQPYFFGHR
jgi:hypothetical protein